MLDELDKKILNQLQDNFPLTQRPYDTIAGQLGITADELLKRTQKLIDDGVIRRMGVSLDSRRLGYSSTLAAVRVNEGLVETAAAVIGKYPEVTHSYQREGDFNIWFTLIAKSPEHIEAILEQIRSELAITAENILNLPATNVFKIDARFNLKTS